MGTNAMVEMQLKLTFAVKFAGTIKTFTIMNATLIPKDVTETVK